jgi:hypothetical protein
LDNPAASDAESTAQKPPSDAGSTAQNPSSEAESTAQKAPATFPEELAHGFQTPCGNIPSEAIKTAASKIEKAGIVDEFFALLVLIMAAFNPTPAESKEEKQSRIEKFNSDCAELFGKIKDQELHARLIFSVLRLFERCNDLKLGLFGNKCGEMRPDQFNGWNSAFASMKADPESPQGKSLFGNLSAYFAKPKEGVTQKPSEPRPPKAASVKAGEKHPKAEKSEGSSPSVKAMHAEDVLYFMRSCLGVTNPMINGDALRALVEAYAKAIGCDPQLLLKKIDSFTPRSERQNREEGDKGCDRKPSPSHGPKSNGRPPRKEPG